MATGQDQYTEAFQRLDEVAREGFAELRARITDLIARATGAEDQALARTAAGIDAAADALAAGFAQFRVDDTTPPVPDEGLPPVINPATPDPSVTDPTATDGLPVDAAAVAADPDVAAAPVAR